MLSTLASETWNFATAAVILGALAGILVQALYELGLLSIFHRRVVLRWIEQRSAQINTAKESTRKPLLQLEREVISVGEQRAVYSLPHEQMCGQISTSLMSIAQHEPKSDLMLMFGSPRARKGHSSEEGVNDQDTAIFNIERHVDSLQINLGRKVKSLDYGLSLLLGMAVLVLLAVSSSDFSVEFLSTPLYVSVIVAAALIAPLVRRYLEAHLRS